MREYDEIEVNTVEDADLFLPGMQVLLGETDDEWTVESIGMSVIGTYIITVYREVN